MKLYLAIVPTYYHIHCVADSEAKAKRNALALALKDLKANGTAEHYGYRTAKDVEEELGCNVYELELNKASRE